MMSYWMYFKFIIINIAYAWINNRRTWNPSNIKSFKQSNEFKSINLKFIISNTSIKTQPYSYLGCPFEFSGSLDTWVRCMIIEYNVYIPEFISARCMFEKIWMFFLNLTGIRRMSRKVQNSTILEYLCMIMMAMTYPFQCQILKIENKKN